MLSLPLDGSGSFFGGVGGRKGRVAQSTASCFPFIHLLSLALFTFFFWAPFCLPRDISYSSSYFIAPGGVFFGGSTDATL